MYFNIIFYLFIKKYTNLMHILLIYIIILQFRIRNFINSYNIIRDFLNSKN